MSVDEETLKRVWAQTLVEPEPSAASAGATLRPRQERTGAAPSFALATATVVGDAVAATVLAPSSSSPAKTTAPGAPDYELLRELGRGGMGVVYRARQLALRREVAIKRPRPDVASDDVRARFLAEALVTGGLDHPNIVPVHELGLLPDGDAFLAMKLVGGVSWREVLHPTSDEQRRRAAGYDRERHLEVLIAVGNAIAYAHSKGVVHRDLKPENVMIGEFGEVLVMDWGIAVAIGEKPRDDVVPHRSSVSAPAGTPSYMAPELALGKGDAIGPCTDVYLLGAILHEILTGRPPHQGTTLWQVILSAVKSDPPRFGPDVPDELQSICRKALAADGSNRQASVGELQTELRGWLSHRQAHELTTKGQKLIERLRAASARLPARGSERDTALVELHRLHAEARFAFEHALEVWAGAPGASAGRDEASRVLLDVAIATEDLGLARRLVLELGDDAPARARVDQLARALDERARELERLRENASRLDWSRVAGPLATLFIAAGVTGGLAGFTSARALAEGPTGTAIAILTVAWGLVVVVPGALAFALLRAGKIPGSLVSGRVLGSWGAVALGCVIVGVMNHLRGAPPLADSCYSSLLIALGFAAMAFQTRRWLLVPAGAFATTALVMAALPPHAADIFSAAWALIMSSVGLALRGGATLGDGSTS